MKAKNMKAGTLVVIKGCAIGTAARFVGRVGEISQSDGCAVCLVIVDGKTFPCNPHEIRKAKEGDVK
jgi:hypothetical protein